MNERCCRVSCDLKVHCSDGALADCSCAIFARLRHGGQLASKFVDSRGSFGDLLGRGSVVVGFDSREIEEGEKRLVILFDGFIA